MYRGGKTLGDLFFTGLRPHGSQGRSYCVTANSDGVKIWGNPIWFVLSREKAEIILLVVCYFKIIKFNPAG